jgi:LuxR family maltose regulon positive regulatory protein
LQALAEAPEAAQPGLGEELRTLALISLGSTEFWAARFEEAERHLEQGVALACRMGRPYLEFTGLVYMAAIEFFRSFARAVERGQQAAELAERHGWADEPAAGLASLVVGGVLAWQGRPEDAEPWVQRAERTSGPKPSPQRDWRRARSAGCWSWRAAGTLTRWPPSRPPTGWPRASPNRT